MGCHKLGLKTPDRSSVVLRLIDFFDHRAVLPNVPADFGFVNDVPDWGMLGNGPDGNAADVAVGDCAIAGPEHIIMGWAAAAGRPVPPFTYATTISAYSTLTGYDPSQTQPDGSNPTDQGSDATEVARWWQSTGFTDASGGTHKIGAFAILEQGDPDQLAAATYTFGAVGVCLQLPESAQQQFADGLPWSVDDSPIEGGHFVPNLGRKGGNFQVCTWDAIQLMEPQFYAANDTMSLVYFSPELLNGHGVSPEGLNQEALQSAWKALAA